MLLVGLTVILAFTSNLFGQTEPSAPNQSLRPMRGLPITKFYETPNPFPPGQPGDLIRSQSFDAYELPSSVSAVRILYHSRSAAGEDVAASGVVLFPYDRKPLSGGWPVIAWAHGDIGVARSCAPSLMRNVGHGPFLAMYVSLGYAIVAPDYTGLGTNFRNAYLDGSSNAIDVINSVAAARAAVPDLGKRWIVMGEAEGGLTAVAVAEKESEIRDPAFHDSGYLGAVAISDLDSVKDIYESQSANPSSFLLASLAYSIKTVYPQFQVTDMLKEKALAVYQQVGQVCSPGKTRPDLSPAETVKPGWTRNVFVSRYFDRNDFGQTRTHRPVLIVSGDADRIEAHRKTAQAISRLCKAGDQVQWDSYPNFDPGTVVGGSVRDQIAWIEARFAGRAPQAACN